LNFDKKYTLMPSFGGGPHTRGNITAQAYGILSHG